jgi:uncharacterized cupin superfamily protein
MENRFCDPSESFAPDFKGEFRRSAMGSGFSGGRQRLCCARKLITGRPLMPKIDIAAVPERKGAGYPPPFDAPCADRVRQRLGNAGGLTDFGINLMRLPPGTGSSQRHFHSHEDEFVYVLEGELTLIEDGGETILRAGDCAAFPEGSGNGHHMINRSGAMAV